MTFRAAFAAITFAFLAACTTQERTPESPAPEEEEQPGNPEGSDASDEGAVRASPMPEAQECAAVTTKTKCRTGGEGAIVRGVVRFDPSLLSGSGKPALSLFLRHSFLMVAGEDEVGGRLHADKRILLRDNHRKSGVVPFEIDMCTYGIEMWSEENGLFNVVAILDEKGAHDLDKAKNAEEALEMQTPAKGELVKMVTGIKVSCRGESPCLDVPLDCKNGTKCTSITPIEEVECEAQSCGSDEAFCKGPTNH